MTKLLMQEVVDRIDLDKEPKYRFDLVYVDYRDSFDPEQVEELLRGGYSDHTDEWISEAQWTSACEVADELFKEACGESEEYDDDYDDLKDEWSYSDERQELIDSIMERDISTPYQDLLRHTGHMLFRVQPSEDEMVWLDPHDLECPGHTLDALKLGPEWLPAVTEILPEIAGYAAEGGGHFMAVLVFSANPGDLWNLPEGAQVMVTEPFLWLTNPWSGNGYGVVAEGVTATVKVEDIHTDKAAWGYGADDVFGGLCLDDSTITGVPGTWGYPSASITDT